MNQTVIGNYIARKRRTMNLTQEQLAEQLGVSYKTISKWENGQVYAGLQRHSAALRRAPRDAAGVDGRRGRGRGQRPVRRHRADTGPAAPHAGAGAAAAGPLRPAIVLGIACGAISGTTGGTAVQDFAAGVLMGLSVAEMLAGIWIIGKQLLHK